MNTSSLRSRSVTRRRNPLFPVLLSSLFSHAAFAATDYWDGTGTTWNNVADWSTSSSATTPNPAAVPGAADTAIFNITPLITAQTLTLDVAQSVSNLTFNTTGALTINAGLSGSLSVGAGGINNNASGTHTINANITLTANQTWTDTGVLRVFAVTAGANLLTINTSGSTQFFGILSGTQGLTKSGNGILTLSGNDSFSGPVLVNAGTFVAGSSLALGNATSITVALNAAFQPDNFSSLSIPLNLAGAGPTGNGALIAPAGSPTTWAGPINAATGGTSFMVGGTGNLTLSGPIGANGSTADVTKVSTNTLTIGGTLDNFSMGLTVNAGTVVLAKTSNATVHAIGGDGLVIEGGAVQLAGTGGDQIYDGAFVELVGGSLDTNGLSETVEELDFQGSGINNTGALLNSAAGNSTFTAVEFEVVSNATIGVSQSTASLTLAGDLQGSSNLTKVGLGALAVTGNISLASSNLIIASGSFIMSNAITAGSVQNSGTFIYNGGTFTSRLVNFGTLTLNADFAPANGLDNESSFTLSTGRILTLGGLGLFNAGTFNLAGGNLALSTAANANNTNAGNFNIAAPFALGAANLTNSGTLSLAGTLLSGTGTLTNAPGGIISGSGSITAPLTNAGTLSPAGGTLTVPAFTNTGTIEMTSPTAPLSGGAIANIGTIEGHGQINNPITNTGTIESTNGNLVFTSSVSSNGTLRTSTGTKLLFQNGGFPINLGLISLTGGTLDTGPSSLINAGQITGYGTLAVGGPVGLLNNGNITLTGGTTTVNGNLTNSTGKTLNIKFQPAIFTGNVTNNGTIKTTSTTVTFTGPYAGNAYISDPATNIFQSTATITPGGSMTGSTGDLFIFGDTFTNNGTFTNGGNLSISSAIINAGTFTQTGPITTSSNATFTNSSGLATFASNAKLANLSITTGTVDITNSKFVIEPANKSTTLATLQSNIATHSLLSSTLPPNFALALLDNAITRFTTFGNNPADTNSLLLSPELLGDANADGHVDLSDLSTILNNFGAATPAWTSGNFDNAPAIDLTDLSDVLNNFGASNPSSSAAPIATPEPASLALLSLALLRTKRRG